MEKSKKEKLLVSIDENEFIELDRAFEASKKRVTDKIKNRENRIEKIFKYNPIISDSLDWIQSLFIKNYISREAKREDIFIRRCEQIRYLRLRLSTINKLHTKIISKKPDSWNDINLNK